MLSLRKSCLINSNNSSKKNLCSRIRSNSLKRKETSSRACTKQQSKRRMSWTKSWVAIPWLRQEIYSTSVIRTLRREYLQQLLNLLWTPNLRRYQLIQAQVLLHRPLKPVEDRLDLHLLLLRMLEEVVHELLPGHLLHQLKQSDLKLSLKNHWQSNWLRPRQVSRKRELRV